MSGISRNEPSPLSGPTLVLAMLANRIPLILLPDLAWPAAVPAADFTPLGAPC
jgi:hypothetical protein